ncbi:cupin domain-containing protein [Undibacterium sp. Jales W-56]|uniref:cupin domain-containing protein n=1 Tax=Undibacterium sp. Jales W-56 TaxID=2897325 RepID=UPI0021CE2F94|nr:cupin domain-containing protein [Undibacterium sp. Jales W-56]MCU6434369.1 cupin domain-containing protein [Undibacterium sp. Jales W-56]
MKTLKLIAHGLTALLLGSPLAVQAHGTAKPDLVFSELVAGMPRGENQAVRVFTASFKPGDKTVFHTHRSPVTVYILEGTFTLELEGRAPVVVKAGQAFVEPANVRMTGYNKSATEALRLVIFYVSEPGTPFLDPLE